MSHPEPEWFIDALGACPEVGVIEVRGAAVAYRAWGEGGQGGVVLVHGGSAHSRWWDHVAPLLATTRRIVALDLSGHGDSARRADYSLDTWAREAFEVAAGAGIAGPPVLVGHSMGGFVALRAAQLFGRELTGVVTVDSPVRDLTPEERAAREHRAFGPLRVYATAEDAIARFRPVPEQPAEPFILEHIARTSIVAVPDGWTWKFDPDVFYGRRDLQMTLDRVDCRVALFRGENGIVSEQTNSAMYDGLGKVAPVVEIPAAGHHVMLDQPLALVAALRTLIADWDHSRPWPLSIA